VGIANFLFGSTWAPTAVEPSYGIFALIVGTILVTLGAMIFAVPLSIGCAIYISELASPRMKVILKPAIETAASQGVEDERRKGGGEDSPRGESGVIEACCTSMLCWSPG